MSILIKGMELPKNCFECPWRCKVDPENLLCRISGEYFEETFSGTIQSRHKSCPLVPVPAHGRLGDLNEFINIKYELPNGQKAFNRGFHSGVQYVQRLIMDAPTIIPAEEGE